MWLLYLFAYLLVGVFVASITLALDLAMFCDDDGIWITLFWITLLWPVFITVGIVSLPLVIVHKLGLFIGRRFKK